MTAYRYVPEQKAAAPLTALAMSGMTIAGRANLGVAAGAGSLGMTIAGRARRGVLTDLGAAGLTLIEAV